MKMKYAGKIALLNNEDSKINFFAGEALVSGEGWPGNLGKMAINREIYCSAN